MNTLNGINVALSATPFLAAGVAAAATHRKDRRAAAEAKECGKDVFDKVRHAGPADVARVNDLCQTLRSHRPDDGRKRLLTGLRDSAMFGLGAAVTAGVFVGAGVLAPVTLGTIALAAVSFGLAAFTGGVLATLQVAYFSRFYQRYETRRDCRDAHQDLIHERAKLQAIKERSPVERAALRGANAELWRLSPVNWALQGAGHFLFGPLMLPVFARQLLPQKAPAEQPSAAPEPATLVQPCMPRAPIDAELLTTPVLAAA